MREAGSSSLFEPKREFYVINRAGPRSWPLHRTELLPWVGDLYDERGCSIGRIKQRVRFESGLEVEMKPEMAKYLWWYLDKAKSNEGETRRTKVRLQGQRRGQSFRKIRYLWEKIKPLKKWNVIIVEGLDGVTAFTMSTEPPFELKDKQWNIFARVGRRTGKRMRLHLCAPGTLDFMDPMLFTRKPDLFAEDSSPWRDYWRGEWRFKIVDHLQKPIAEFGPCNNWPNMFVKTAGSSSLDRPLGETVQLPNFENAYTLHIQDLSYNQMVVMGLTIAQLYERFTDMGD